MSWWIWVLLAFALLALELTAATLHIGFFAAGALVVGLLVLFGVEMPLWMELHLTESVWSRSQLLPTESEREQAALSLRQLLGVCGRRSEVAT